MHTILATIQLDDDGGIGEIYAALEPEGIHTAYTIYVRESSGGTREASIAPCRTRDDVLRAIETAWSLPCWRLVWDDAAVERWVGI